MKNHTIRFLTLVASLVLWGPGQAADGYWFGSGGEVWRSGAGECVHTGFWQSAMAIVGCDGKQAEAPAVTVAPPPAPVPVPVAAGSVDGTVNFGFDKADLDKAAVAGLDDLLRRARNSGEIGAVRLTGHTDRVGTEEYNLDLSLRRAGSVNDHLVGAGVDPRTIEISGKGESQPLVGCEGLRGAAALECLAPNRRVEIILELIGR